MAVTPRPGRREFLGQLSLGAMVLVGGGIQQDPATPRGIPGGGENGRLYDPNAVQQRAPTVEADNDEFVMAVEKTIKCQCGCNLDVYTCRTTDFTCTTSPAMHRKVVALWSNDRTADQIREAFIREYGEQALMAPTREGFNLAGYFVPGAVMLTGIGILSLWILRRQRQVAAEGVVTAPEESPELVGTTPEELERLQRALREVRD